jgi:cation diffusion facilitator family transporter
VRPEGFTAHEAHQARRLRTVVVLVGSFFILELGGALWADSVVLQADALHLLTDVLALAANLLAMRIAVRAPTARFTYGLRRAEPVAAMAGALLVLSTTAVVVVEAVHALRETAPPRAGIMLVVAVGALFVNGASAWLLHDALGQHNHEPTHDHDHDHDHDPAPAPASASEHAPAPASAPAPAPASAPAPAPASAPAPAPAHNHGHALNLRSAWLHMVGDTLGALAAIAAALVIRAGGPPMADPLASFLVAAILVVGSLRIVRDAGLVLLEAAPAHLPVATIRALVAGFPEVTSVRALHVWTLGAGHDAIAVHVQTRSRDAGSAGRLSARLKRSLGVEYATVQVEPEELSND